MKKITVIIAILLTIFLYSCKSEVDCPGFPEEERDWAPYTVGDTIKLLGDKDTISFVVDTFFITKPSTLVMGYWEDCECEALFFNIFTKIENLILNLNLSVSHGGQIDTYIYLYVHNDYTDSFTYTEITDNWLYEDTVSINGKDYYGAITIDDDRNRNEKYAQVKIVKGLGLYEITEKSGKVWRLEVD